MYWDKQQSSTKMAKSEFHPRPLSKWQSLSFVALTKWPKATTLDRKANRLALFYQVKSNITKISKYLQITYL